MKRFLLSSKRNVVSSLLVGALVLAVTPAGFAAKSDESHDDSPNLARLGAGAQIECTTPDGRIEVLKANEPNGGSAAVLRDETLSCALQEGVTTFVIKLPTTALLDRFTFVNENAAAAGELKISVSNYQLPAASSKWVDVDGNVIFSRKRLFNLSMLGVEARYVKLSFNVESGGRLGALSVYGAKPLVQQSPAADGGVQLGWVDNVEKPRKDARDLDFDFATTGAKGRVVYVSSGQQPVAVKMIDGNTETAFAFAATDRRPTAIIELGALEKIHRVRALYKAPRAGRFDVYLVEDISKSATDLNYRQPVASASAKDGDGSAAVEFDPEGTRYVAVRFTPSDAAAGSNRAFELVELNAYGDMPMAMLDLVEAPDVYVEHSAASFPGEGGPEISSKLGVIAVPPIPNISE